MWQELEWEGVVSIAREREENRRLATGTILEQTQYISTKRQETTPQEA